ncbi:MAG: carboxylating nicotinate-nucleotide diphosphorylase [Bdellovibrionaceae bacterium]|nr:carboxylating nicotinate-nucleotide diphosphorylase [Pseudobdellovibrionaceae bacterium]NUM59629.1 carboxylating nicotinate-nucleotide diphosphorylase [Pseudobdellovibrionaceae bacterium]
MILSELIKAAIKEDMPQGDVTTESLGLLPQQGKAVLKAKEDLVLSGLLPFENTMMIVEPSLKIKWNFEEGQSILKGQNICSLEGDLLQILKAERVALNFLGHLSGIATYTRRFVEAVKGTETKILDTRKTLPGFRDLEKKAVVHGGGVNHRMNLSTAILIKDNHIAVMGGITKAVHRVRENSDLKIEVEVANLEQIKEAIQLKVDRILLDNMNNELLTEARKLIPKSIETEASGNMTLSRVSQVAAIGIDFISVGALTHSAPVADVSLQFEWRK